jgi:hypothetical protein
MEVSIGGDIKVFWNLPEEKIADTSSNEVGYKSMTMEAVENL